MSELVFVEETPLRGRRQPVVAVTTIGREGCDVLLPDPDVSRRHAVVLDTTSGPALHDLDSTNGTFVNGRRIRDAHRLRAGDVVQFGNTIWHVVPAEGDGRDGARAVGVSAGAR